MALTRFSPVMGRAADSGAAGSTASIRRPYVVSVSPDGEGDDTLRALTGPARAYVTLVIGAGALLFAMQFPAAWAHPRALSTLLVLSLVLSLFKVTLPLARGEATMTLAHAPDLVCLLVAGPEAAMVIAVASVGVQCLVRARKRIALHRTLFSMASLVITLQVLAAILEWFGPLPDHLPLAEVAVPLLALTTMYFVVNSLLVASAVALSKRVSLRAVWHDDFLWSAPSYFLAGAVAVPTTWAIRQEMYWAIPVAIVPLFFTYRAYRIYLRRVEKEQSHARELATLNEATSAALARAVESEQALAIEKQELAAERERLAVTLKSIGDGVITTDLLGRIVLMNAAAEAMIGQPWSAVAGRQLTDVVPADVEHSTEHARGIHEVLRNGIESRRVPIAGARNGSRPRVIESRGTPIRDAARAVTGGVWVLRDVTDTVRLEEERAKAAKLESLGVLAGGLAHDFNNILTGVVGNISLAQAAPAADREILTRLNEAERACLRAKGITSQLLTFSKGGAPVRTSAPLSTLVADCTRFCLHGSNVAATMRIPSGVWPANVDVNQISQVVQNLVLNAQQAMPDGGALSVVMENVEVAEGQIATLRPGRYVRIGFTDQGVGIPPAHLPRIFDPYFTTKEKGSGLGLATCYSIINRHGGLIAVDSAEGSGTTFDIYLPASSQAAEPLPSAGPEPAHAGGGRVLVMDDDEAIRELAPEMLATLGYEGAVAAHGAEAVALFKAAANAGRPFDVVIVDLTVPGGLGGRQTVPLLQQIDPAVKVAVSSGYADDAIMADYQAYGFSGVIPKPYVVSDLREALRRMGV